MKNEDMKAPLGKPKAPFKSFNLHVILCLFAVALLGTVAPSTVAQQTPQQRPPVFRGESVLVTV